MAENLTPSPVGGLTERVSSFRHLTVLAQETVALLAPSSPGLICDATVGGGGHAERILEASSPAGRLIGIDRDPSALTAAGERLRRFGDRVTLVHGTFDEAPQIFARHQIEAVDGFVLDVGVSSPQLDVAERGFSFQRPGPLDMRMDPTGEGETAHELIARLDMDDLARVLREYGEERYAGRIARHIKEALAEDKLHTTTELAALIARAVPTKERSKDPATRTFQALRVAVNDELGQLERVLAALPSLLRPGGRVVIIAFHSLEDALVKNRFRDLSRHPGVPPDVAAAMGIPPHPIFHLLTRKPVTAGEAELAENPRARSARLRAAERVAV